MAQRKIKTLVQLSRIVGRLRAQRKTVVFTNGCFDILHVGHLRLIEKAKTYGDFLIVAINADASVRRLKGPSRPIQNERDRATLLAGFTAVDAVVIFGEDTPARVIETLRPDVLAKGGDWKRDQIVGSDCVKKVVRFPTVSNRSTTNIIKKW